MREIRRISIKDTLVLDERVERVLARAAAEAGAGDGVAAEVLLVVKEVLELRDEDLLLMKEALEARATARGVVSGEGGARVAAAGAIEI